MHNPTSPIRIWKVGGSLLDLPDLEQRLECVLSAESPHRPLLIVGGGATADVVRHWDRVHKLGDATAHQLAIAAMSFNERLLTAICGPADHVRSLSEAKDIWAQQRWPVLCCEHFLADNTLCDLSPLEESWETTSDSIAAWVALAVHAESLHLLKSVDEANDNNAVDAQFSRWGQHLPAVNWINLRAV